MVGAAGSPGGGGAPLSAAVKAGYDAAAEGWTAGPGQVYGPLAQALVRSAGVPLAGRRVLDLGAGTALAGAAALAAGARLAVAADIAIGMLRHVRPPLRRVAADASALPFRDQSFDLIVAAFCLNHLPDVAAALAEARRVGAALAASTFAPGWSVPAKAAVDRALMPFGYREPGWYAMFKDEIEPAAGDPSQLARRASAAGFTHVQLATVRVETGLTAPEQLASWRLGMAHIAPFVRSLDPARRAAARRGAEQAVAAECAAPLVVPMVVLTAG
jgi:SAM-dependent methyltransferase